MRLYGSHAVQGQARRFSQERPYQKRCANRFVAISQAISCSRAAQRQTQQQQEQRPAKTTAATTTAATRPTFPPVLTQNTEITTILRPNWQGVVWDSNPGRSSTQRLMARAYPGWGVCRFCNTQASTKESTEVIKSWFDIKSPPRHRNPTLTSMVPRIVLKQNKSH